MRVKSDNTFQGALETVKDCEHVRNYCSYYFVRAGLIPGPGICFDFLGSCFLLSLRFLAATHDSGTDSVRIEDDTQGV